LSAPSTPPPPLDHSDASDADDSDDGSDRAALGTGEVGGAEAVVPDAWADSLQPSASAVPPSMSSGTDGDIRPSPAMPSDTDDDGSVSQSVVIQTDYTEYCSDTEYSGVEDETAVTVGWSIGGRLSF
jgi:hypothetical protein